MGIVLLDRARFHQIPIARRFVVKLNHDSLFHSLLALSLCNNSYKTTNCLIYPFFEGDLQFSINDFLAL
jgi:hypothetical protein